MSPSRRDFDKTKCMSFLIKDEKYISIILLWYSLKYQPLALTSSFTISILYL